MDDITLSMINQSNDDYVRLLETKIKHLELDNKVFQAENKRYRDKLNTINNNKEEQ